MKYCFKNDNQVLWTILSLSVDTKPKITAGADHNLGVIVSNTYYIMDRQTGFFLLGIGGR